MKGTQSSDHNQENHPPATSDLFLPSSICRTPEERGVAFSEPINPRNDCSTPLPLISVFPKLSSQNGLGIGSCDSMVVSSVQFPATAPNTRAGDTLQADKPPQYFTKLPGQLSLRWEMSIGHSAVMVCGWGVKAGWLIPYVDKRVGGR